MHLTSVAFHILTANFESHEAAEVYCYDTLTPNDPEQINLDQPNATIDTNCLELAFRDEIGPFLNALFDPTTAANLMVGLDGISTVISIRADGLLGSDGVLMDTDTLTYLGLFQSKPTT